MEKTKSKAKKLDAKSFTPYVRRPEEEMLKIASEIRSGLLAIRSASLKYGICRNTLKLYLTKQAILTLAVKDTAHIPISTMYPELKESTLKREIQKLAKELEFAKLKILSLETMINVAEKDLNIKIRKKRGTKQSKD